MLPLPPIRGTYRTDPRARAAYAEGAGIYRIVPQAVALPADLPDLQSLVRWAAEHRVPLTPRGAGSGMGGGNVGPGVLVDLTRMADRRLEVDAASRCAFTSAQVTLAELNSAAAPLGLRLPPDPSSGRWATLGGMAATNAAGARSVRYGSVRRWIEALTMVTADGEAAVLRRGRQVAVSDTVALTRFEQNAAPGVRAATAWSNSAFPDPEKTHRAMRWIPISPLRPARPHHWQRGDARHHHRDRMAPRRNSQPSCWAPDRAAVARALGRYRLGVAPVGPLGN